MSGHQESERRRSSTREHTVWLLAWAVLMVPIGLACAQHWTPWNLLLAAPLVAMLSPIPRGSIAGIRRNRRLS
jgi:hypothetical protein